MRLDIHLDPIGGMAGDMFIAALLDAFPAHERRVHDAIGAFYAAAGEAPVRGGLVAHRDAVLQGRQFRVQRVLRAGEAATPAASPASSLAAWPAAAAPLPAGHAHTTWRSIRDRLQQAPLEPGVRAHAVEIFRHLAEAEGAVHGIEADAVAFHEVGAWDSIADVVGAAALIHAIDASQWSVSAVPLGSGRVRTAHGVLPVPAPATARLLLGFATLDDGIGGERVTPTGAAILRHLCPPPAPGAAAVASPERRLLATGTGFGTRTLPGLSNHLRVLCFEPIAQAAGGHRLLDVLEFEIDDQSGEDLAAGLDRLRAHEAVLDVTQAPVFGKKGRLMTRVQVLSRRPHALAVAEACFRETTTIGLRHRAVQGIGLERRIEEVAIGDARVRVKVVERPGGRTAKAEADDLQPHTGHAHRAALRARAERLALQGDPRA